MPLTPLGSCAPGSKPTLLPAKAPGKVWPAVLSFDGAAVGALGVTPNEPRFGMDEIAPSASALHSLRAALIAAVEPPKFGMEPTLPVPAALSLAAPVVTEPPEPTGPCEPTPPVLPTPAASARSDPSYRRAVDVHDAGRDAIVPVFIF